MTVLLSAVSSDMSLASAERKKRRQGLMPHLPEVMAGLNIISER
jgi:hypothetical protein